MRRSIVLAVTVTVAAALAAGAFGASGAAGRGGLTAKVAAGWSARPIADGIKPVLALDRRGVPGIAYLQEAPNGFVAFASAANGWKPQVAARGYFYGPIGLAFDSRNEPNIAYHDHQATQLNPNLGDLTLAVRQGAGWKVQALKHPGHDGWDSTIAIAKDGVVRAAGVNPSQFGSSEGVDYYELRNGHLKVTPVGSGPIAYEFNVSLAVDPKGDRPALTYYNDRSGDLEYASFDGKRWRVEAVATAGDQGKFSSLAFDAKGAPHVSFFQQTGASTGIVRYAVKAGTTWKVENVAPLTNVQIGMLGARRNSSLALDRRGVPHIAFSDQSVVAYAVKVGKRWQVQTVAKAGGRPFGQLVSLALSRSGKAQLAYFEVTGLSPELQGKIVYASQK